MNIQFDGTTPKLLTGTVDIANDEDIVTTQDYTVKATAGDGISLVVTSGAITTINNLAKGATFEITDKDSNTTKYAAVTAGLTRETTDGTKSILTSATNSFTYATAESEWKPYIALDSATALDLTDDATTLTAAASYPNSQVLIPNNSRFWSDEISLVIPPFFHISSTFISTNGR